MKRFSILFLFVGILIRTTAQVTTEPAFVTQDYTGKIVVTFDPSQGNKGMMNATKCYAHTGLITSKSTNSGDWKYATKTWRDEEAKYKMTKVGSKWQLTIDNMYAYYGCPTSEPIEQIAFVFNDGKGGSKEGKTADGKDIFVQIYEKGLNVLFEAPTENKLLNAGESVTFTAKASQPSQLVFKMNGTVVKTVASGASLSYTHKFSAVGDYECVVEATLGGETVNDKCAMCVIGSATTGARPSGMKDGINYSADGTQATLVMYAKDNSNNMADNVFVLGDFNNFSYQNDYQMIKDGTSGYFWLTIDDLVPGEEYAFQYAVKEGNSVVKVTDAYTEKVLDPWNDSYLTDVYPGLNYPEGGDGLLAVLQPGKQAFEWSDATLHFEGPDKNNLVIYELWVGNYSQQKTIKEVTHRLDYFVDLGINAIELMPITEFDGNISWGYNPNHFFAADKAYGTEDDYKTFIDECHKRGIAVIIDMVFNHATGVSPWAKLYWNSSQNKTSSLNPWFNVDAPHDWSVFHDYNHENAMVRNYFKEVLKYWVNEYKVDGYRLDLTKGFTQGSDEGAYDAKRIATLKEYYNASKVADFDTYFIIEHFCDYSEEKELVDAGMMPWRNLNHGYSQLAMGFQSESNVSGSNVKGWVSFNESHDEERNFFKAKTYGNGTVKSIESERLGRVPAIVLLNAMQPGPKMFWQYAELGYDISIDENGRTGEKPLPETMGWFADGHLRMKSYQKIGQALQLRTSIWEDMFTSGTCDVRTSSGSVRWMRWTHGEDQLIVLANLNPAQGNSPSGNASVSPFPASGTWYEYFTGQALSVSSVSHSLSIPAGVVRIYTNKKIALPSVPDGFDWGSGLPAEPEVDPEQQCEVYPTVVSDVLNIRSTVLLEQVQVYNLHGRLVRQTGHVEQISVDDMSAGLYFVVCHYAEGREVFKVMKQ